MSTVPGNGDGTFAGALYFSAPIPSSFLTGDVDGDGLNDIVFAMEAALKVLKGDGAGRISGETTTTFSNLGVRGLDLRDLDGDGRADITLVDVQNPSSSSNPSALSINRVLANLGPVFNDLSVVALTRTSPWLTIGLSGLLVADLNADGLPDVATRATGELLVALGRPPAGVDAGPDLDVFTNSYGVAEVVLTGTVTSNPSGDVLAQAWLLGGATVGTATSFTRSLTPGEYVFTFTARESSGAVGSDSVTIRVHLPMAQPGPPGAQGIQGPPGRDGTGIMSVPEPAGPNCATGGVKLIPLFSDGTVAGAPTYVCNGLNAQVPMGTLVFLLAGSPAPEGYTLIGTFDLTPSGGPRGRPAVVRVDVYQKN